MNIVGAMREAGLSVEILQEAERERADAPAAGECLRVSAEGVIAGFIVLERRRAPYPAEVADLMARHPVSPSCPGRLLAAPYVSDALGRRLGEAGWSWADEQGNFGLRAPGMVLSQRVRSSPPPRRRSRLPGGSGALAIIRALICFMHGEDEPQSATALAAQANVSQPRASQVLGRLTELGLVEKTAQRRFRPNRVRLLDQFLADYAGPGGSERCYYSLNSPTDVAGLIARSPQVEGQGTDLAVSADVGSDLIIGWHRPQLLIVYAIADIDPATVGLTPARGRHDANVLIRDPADRSVFPNPVQIAELHGVEVPLADPTQLIWDLEDLGGDDRLDAAGELRKWLITRP